MVTEKGKVPEQQPGRPQNGFLWRELLSPQGLPEASVQVYMASCLVTGDLLVTGLPRLHPLSGACDVDYHLGYKPK
jgi:hypothetical protein